MHLIDTHSHLTFGPLAEQVDAVLERSRQAGVRQWITVGTEPRQNAAAVKLAARQSNLYATVGIHPHDAKDVTAETLVELDRLAQSEQVVALGETGLDYHYDYSPRTDQKRVFAQQLDIARRLHLPVIVHSREAFEDTIDILDRHASGIHSIVFHCFGGDAEQARIVLDRGWYISFTGVVTFKNAQIARAAAQRTPLDRMMLETDCPFMSPEPMRKQKTNEPALMVHTARFLADLKGVDYDTFAAAVTKTSTDFFRLPIIE